MGAGDITRWPPGFSSATLLANTFPFIVATVTKGGDIYAVFWPGDSVLELAHGGSSWQTIVSARYLPKYSDTEPYYGVPCLDKRGNLYLPDGSPQMGMGITMCCMCWADLKAVSSKTLLFLAGGGSRCLPCTMRRPVIRGLGGTATPLSSLYLCSQHLIYSLL